jgi:hypothetical protein
MSGRVSLNGYRCYKRGFLEIGEFYVNIVIDITYVFYASIKLSYRYFSPGLIFGKICSNAFSCVGLGFKRIKMDGTQI